MRCCACMAASSLTNDFMPAAQQIYAKGFGHLYICGAYIYEHSCTCI